MNVRIAQLLSINAGAWYDGVLEMNQYTIKLWMITQTENPLEQNIAFLRAKHFIYNLLENTIFMDSEDSKCADFIQAGLRITTLPGDPADQLIGIMLFHKLNAIMEDRIRLLEVEISAGDAVIYLHGENENVNDVITPGWWETSDVVHCDSALLDSEKVVTMHKGSVWRELDLSWPEFEDESDDMTPVDESGNTVVFADFKRLDDTK